MTLLLCGICTDIVFDSVHPYAGPVRSVPLHGSRLTEWHPGNLNMLSRFYSFHQGGVWFPVSLSTIQRVDSWFRFQIHTWGLRTRSIVFVFKFWERIKLYLMPPKHQPDFSFLRHVPLRRVHLFTLVQIVCLAVLWILKSTFLAIIFPVMVSVCILVLDVLLLPIIVKVSDTLNSSPQSISIFANMTHQHVLLDHWFDVFHIHV